MMPGGLSDLERKQGKMAGTLRLGLRSDSLHPWSVPPLDCLPSRIHPFSWSLEALDSPRSEAGGSHY